jgi:hypothetical protein
MMEKISWVNKRHPYEVDEKKKKKTTQKRLWMRKKRMIKKCIESASTHTHNEANTIFGIKLVL